MESSPIVFLSRFTTDVSIPLVWKTGIHHHILSSSMSSSFGRSSRKAEHELSKKKFAVFCMFKVESDIFDTSLVTVDSSVTDISFEGDVAVFENIPSNFEILLEVYSTAINSDGSLSTNSSNNKTLSTPRRMKERLTASLGRTFGRKLVSSGTGVTTSSGVVVKNYSDNG